MECIKLINAEQAQSTYTYKNTKKLHSTNAATWCIKICWLHHLTQRYMNITINGNNQQYIADL
jgi:hypothetical protein